MRSSLWYNRPISNDTLYVPHWHKKGIQTVGDIINESGDILALKQIEHKFGIKPNVFHYSRIKILVGRFIRQYKKENRFVFTRPYLLRHVSILVSPDRSPRVSTVNKIN